MPWQWLWSIEKCSSILSKTYVRGLKVRWEKFVQLKCHNEYFKSMIILCGFQIAWNRHENRKNIYIASDDNWKAFKGGVGSYDPYQLNEKKTSRCTQKSFVGSGSNINSLNLKVKICASHTVGTCFIVHRLAWFKFKYLVEIKLLSTQVCLI